MTNDPFDRMWNNIKRQLHEERDPLPLPINPYPTVPYTISYARSFPPGIALTPEMEKALWKAADEMARRAEAHFLGVDSLQVWNKPTPQPALTYEHLNELRKALDAKDPLLQKGIQRDWLCILSPTMERLLRTLIQQGLITLPPRWEEFRLMDELMGRPTHVIEGAHDGIVYMDERVARWAYPAYFARLDEQRLEMLRAVTTPLEQGGADEEEGQ